MLLKAKPTRSFTSKKPSKKPTKMPLKKKPVKKSPTNMPTKMPTTMPTKKPTKKPAKKPIKRPVTKPTTMKPFMMPISMPTMSPEVLSCYVNSEDVNSKDVVRSGPIDGATVADSKCFKGCIKCDGGPFTQDSCESNNWILGSNHAVYFYAPVEFLPTFSELFAGFSYCDGNYCNVPDLVCG